MKTRAQELGEAIGKDRARTGASQEDLADAVGVTQQAFSGWEKGESIPRRAKLLKLWEIFGPNSHTGMMVGHFVPEDVLVRHKADVAKGEGSHAGGTRPAPGGMTTQDELLPKRRGRPSGVGGPRTGSFLSKLEPLAVGEAVWIETTAADYTKLMRQATMASRFPIGMEERRFSARTYTAVGGVSDVRVLLRVERVA